ncbi:MAG: ubiquitin-specific protease ubp2 [Candelina submexicana]|nr:MAG: ubiquitin-specific protease ubp2 [Candelina submexicana]
MLELGQDSEGQQCPNKEYPLHHMQHDHYDSPGRHEQIEGRAWVEEQRFECSSPQCSAAVTIRFSPARLTAEHVTLLTDPKLLEQRAEVAIAMYPDRFREDGVSSPMRVLHILRTYIKDAIHTEGKRFGSMNKNFMLCFGEACNELLEYLGFSYSKSDEYWNLPNPDRSQEIPIKDPLKILLNDVDIELMALMEQRPASEKSQISVQFIPLSAMKWIEQILGLQEFRQAHPSPRRTIDLTQEEHPCFASLGAVGDFSDDLIIFAYERQKLCDIDNAPYYLECLQDLGELRQSEILQTKAVMMQSEGEISTKDIREAYRYFGFDSQSSSLNDETIIGVFQSRLSDAPRQEADARLALRIIGQSRGSEKILHLALKSLTNAEQALGWLNAASDTPDDFIITMVTIKITDNKSDTEAGREAIRLIAEQRNSAALRNWLETGEMGVVEMNVGEAYTRLGIEDRTLDDDMIITTYGIRISESPHQLQDLRKALEAIAKDRGSRQIEDFLSNGQLAQNSVSVEWPVGLENIGNTCYLNSLLQFYFTVKPLRDLVLHFDDYKMDLDLDSLRKKQVGSRRVSRKEVERAQSFVYALQKLFQRLISARASSITPERELARLTLISSSNEEAFRRMSMASKDGRPSLGDINGVPMQGPLGPPLPQEMETQTSQSKQHPVEDVTGDNASDTTLVEPPNYDDSGYMVVSMDEKEQQQEILDDKENLKPSNKSLPDQSRSLSKPLEPSSPSRLNEQEHQRSSAKDISSSNPDLSLTNGLPRTPDTMSPPDRPPPVPPRPLTLEQTKPTHDEVELGAQQDVTEVIANVLFQMQCAIKANNIDTDGEQLDEIKSLFYGKTKSYIKKDGSVRTKEEFFSDIKVDVASGPRDIYAALDGAFDVQNVDVDGTSSPQYGAISLLPPVLQIQVQRVQFDQAKKASYKSEAHLKLEETIYLDRYMDSGNAALMQRREEAWRWKERVRELETRKAILTLTDTDMDLPEVIDMTQGYLMELQSAEDDDVVMVNPDVLQALNENAADMRHIETEITHLNTSITSQFTDLRALPYRLHSVFIHRGTAMFGHYWIYIYDFKKDIWRRYNDSYVTEIKDRREVFEQETTNPATPYFLVYVRESDIDRLVDPVCRELEPEPQWDAPPIADCTDNMEVIEGVGPDEYRWLSASTSQGANPAPSHQPAWDSSEAHSSNHW